jgi:hypothetical protein
MPETRVTILAEDEIKVARYYRDMYLSNDGTDFKWYLNKTIFKADMLNLRKLVKAYPAEVYAYAEYAWGQVEAVKFMTRNGVVADPSGLLNIEEEE